MSMEYYDPSRGQPLSSLEQDIFNSEKIDILMNNYRANLDLSKFSAGTTFLMETDEGQVEFSIYPTGLAEKINPHEAIYAQVKNAKGGAIIFPEIMIYGASEELTMVSKKLGTIEQFADFVYAPLQREPLWKEDYELSENDFQAKLQLGEIVQTQMGNLHVTQHGYRVLPSVLDLAIKSPDGMYEDIFVCEV